jgi:hypothetical protein
MTAVTAPNSIAAAGGHGAKSQQGKMRIVIICSSQTLLADLTPHARQAYSQACGTSDFGSLPVGVVICVAIFDEIFSHPNGGLAGGADPFTTGPHCFRVADVVSISVCQPA